MDYQTLIYTFVIFILIFATSLIIYRLCTEKKLERQKIIQRLEQMSENNPEFVKVNKVNLFQNKRKNIVERKINEYLIHIQKENEFKLIVERMGLNFTISQLGVIFLASIFLTYVIISYFLDLGFIENFVAAIVTTAIIFIFSINYIISSRQKKFLSELPFAIEILVRSVKSGFSLDRAFGIVSREIKEPLSTELQNIVRKIELGVSFQQTFRNSSSRLKLREYTFFCNALIIQHETGGRLEDILTNILYTLKRNIDLKLKIQSLTAEIKTTGIILGAAPVFIWFFMLFTKPEHINYFLHEPSGQRLIKYILAMFITECLVIYYMLRIKVE